MTPSFGVEFARARRPLRELGRPWRGRAAHHAGDGHLRAMRHSQAGPSIVSPHAARLWVQLYGEQNVFASFPGSKLYLLLQKELAISGVPPKRSLRQALLPLRLPPGDRACECGRERCRCGFGAIARSFASFFFECAFTPWRVSAICVSRPAGSSTSMGWRDDRTKMDISGARHRRRRSPW